MGLMSAEFFAAILADKDDGELAEGRCGRWARTPSGSAMERWRML